MARPKTLYDKLWDAHCVKTRTDGTALLYIDRHLIHEVTSAQAFAGLRLAGRQLWRKDTLVAVADHQVPTERQSLGAAGIEDPLARIQVVTLDENCREWNVQQIPMTAPEQGIVHVVGPENGWCLPGMTIACGDSHTSTHGALAALAQGVGSSEVEHIMATQCLLTRKSDNLRVQVNGDLPEGTTAKDLALYIIGRLGVAGGTGYVIEFCGSTIRDLSMEGRFTLCNMAIELGARTGLIAFDSTTEAYVAERPQRPRGEHWRQALYQWRTLHSDPGAEFAHSYEFRAENIEPHITWGTRPDQVVPVSARVPDASGASDAAQLAEWHNAWHYMGLTPGTAMTDLRLDQVFIGSCTNSRIEDLRSAASVIAGRKIAPSIKRAMVVPGSGLIRAQAEREGLDRLFIEAGFEWREPGCSMCNAMNPDFLAPGDRCASTSNRNFESRQGYRGRTHLVSPAMAAAAAIAGRFVDVREFS